MFEDVGVFVADSRWWYFVAIKTVHKYGRKGRLPGVYTKATDDDNKGGATGQGLIRWRPGNNDDQARSQ